MFTMNDLFEIAIKMEKNGEKTYIDSIGKVENPELKTLLQWMADEESAHAGWFRRQQERLSLGDEEANLKKMLPQGLQEMMGENTLNLDEIDFESIDTVPQLLDTFIEFEKETILFYELLEMFIEDDQVKKGLQGIIDEEKSHIEKISTMVNSVREDSL